MIKLVGENKRLETYLNDSQATTYSCRQNFLYRRILMKTSSRKQRLFANLLKRSYSQNSELHDVLQCYEHTDSIYNKENDSIYDMNSTDFHPEFELRNKDNCIVSLLGHLSSKHPFDIYYNRPLSRQFHPLVLCEAEKQFQTAIAVNASCLSVIILKTFSRGLIFAQYLISRISRCAKNSTARI